MSSTILKEANNRYLAPLAHLVYLMIKKKKDSFGRRPLHQSLLSSVSKKRWTEDVFCLLYLDISFHISFPVQLLKEGASYSRRSEADREQQCTNVWLLSLGRRLATLSIIFMGLFFFFLKEQSCVDRSEVSGGAWVLAHGSGWPLPHPH